ncbi:hypothetical protein DFH27DRAFT_390610 [Peziza echinospora]|nr:hypothetical protein DFH27DRAFT_390610 [Peziza echinospora]
MVSFFLSFFVCWMDGWDGMHMVRAEKGWLDGREGWSLFMLKTRLVKRHLTFPRLRPSPPFRLSAFDFRYPRPRCQLRITSPTKQEANLRGIANHTRQSKAKKQRTFYRHPLHPTDHTSTYTTHPYHDDYY